MSGSYRGPDDDYVEVNERIQQFRDKHPEGSLQSEIVDCPFEGFVAVKAYAYRTPDDPRPGVGLAWEPVPGQTPFTKDTELMNAETSAWGRALIAVGAADAKRGIASASEVRSSNGYDLAARAQQKATEQANFDPAPEDVVRGLLQDATKVWADKDNARGEVWKRLHHEAKQRGLPAPESFRDIHPDLVGPVGQWVGEQTQAARDPDNVAEEVPF